MQGHETRCMWAAPSHSRPSLSSQKSGNYRTFLAGLDGVLYSTDAIGTPRLFLAAFPTRPAAVFLRLMDVLHRLIVKIAVRCIGLRGRVRQHEFPHFRTFNSTDHHGQQA